MSYQSNGLSGVIGKPQGPLTVHRLEFLPVLHKGRLGTLTPILTNGSKSIGTKNKSILRDLPT